MEAHGIMFHHFHSEKHIECQGSISSDDLTRIIDYCEMEYNLIPASDFFYKSVNNRLDSRDVCLAFDDGLLCQYDVAFPILTERGLNAFWFVNSAPLVGIAERLEIYHHFRFSVFRSVDEFYDSFFQMGSKMEGFEHAFQSKEAFLYKIGEGYYSENDRRFRYVRDCYLGEEGYCDLMDKMMEKYNYNSSLFVDQLWIGEDQIRKIHDAGNIIGLHSHSHPTVMVKLSYHEQYEEYYENKRILESIVDCPIRTVAYPCNSYNKDTIDIIKKLGIKLGFRANMNNEYYFDKCLEIPREDHALIMREIRKNEDNCIYE